jgi:hypothetical protein
MNHVGNYRKQAKKKFDMVQKDRTKQIAEIHMQILY